MQRVDREVVDGTMPVALLRLEQCRSNRRSPLKEEIRMNVLTLMVIIVLAYWVIGMFLVSKQKNWD